MKSFLFCFLAMLAVSHLASAQTRTLKGAFDQKFLVGVAINRSQIHQRNDEEHRLICTQFNSVTAENDMKWMHIHPKKDEFNFEHADKLVALAEANDMFVVGHTLVWHNQLAPWVFKRDDGTMIDSAELTRRMKDHIRTIVGRYKGKVHGWDVVNEALAEDGTLRKSPFLNVGGERYIEKAFRFAREADPDAELYYNDYNLVNAKKRDGAIRIIRNLQQKGIKVDGVGIQAHWGLTYPSLEEIERAIMMYSELGIQVMFTELDVSVLPSPHRMPTADVSERFRNTPAMDPYVNGLPNSVQRQLADRYAAIFKLFNKHADKISRVTFWGLHDGVSWKNNFPIRGRTDYALLFDRERTPKEAYHAVIATAEELESGAIDRKGRMDFEHVFTSETDDPFPESSLLTTKKSEGGFSLVENGQPADILVSDSDHPGVLKVARLFQKDLSRVSGREAELAIGKGHKAENVIIVGTVGKSALIDRLIKDKKISVGSLTGKWEQFLVIPVSRPIEGVSHGLVVVGSDKRGTIFGMFHLSERMGVSPWYWWADVPVKVRRNIFVKSGVHTLGEPKVKYRGIFINDEAPALTGWVREKFGGFNHDFYEKVFELILRNKGNYLWPAMWRPRVFATDDPENMRLADEYGIVISTTHHEPMMRYHEEWSRYNGGAWNYETNKEKLREFWRGGIERMGTYESVVTLGMRGDGDEAMSEETAVGLMKTIIADQRRIIADVTGKPAKETPQVWAIYKEVQDYYDKGLRVDDDILVLFCDDNWGNVRILPKKEERDRKGGYGMYYHFDFVGGPVSYRWINVTQIERVWEQMNLAYAWGVQDLWIVNVGDIKPMELPISFFLDFAWNTDMTAADLPAYYEHWTEQQFGVKQVREIAEVVALYTKYSARRTPEMLKPDTYSLENYREADRILHEYNKLFDKSKSIYEALPETHKQAYYQLVHFPIAISRNLNEMYIAAAKNRLYASQSRASSNLYADMVKDKFFEDEELTRYFHERLSDGKWDHMMAQTHIGYTNWNNPPVNKMPDVSYIQVPASAGLGYVLEHGVQRSGWNRGGLFSQSFQPFDALNDQQYYIEVFNRGREKLRYTVESKNDWIKLSGKGGVIQYDERIFVSIDWDKVPEGTQAGEVAISGAGQEYTIKVPIRSVRRDMSGFIENNGVVSMEAAHFSRKYDANKISWTVVPNMGRTGSSVTIEPADAASQSPGKAAPRLEYDFSVFDGGDLNVDVYLSPTLNYKKNNGLKYAIAIDDEKPQIVNIHEGDSIPDWQYPDWWNNSVTDHIRIKQSVHKAVKPGNHVLKIWMIDPGVVFQKLVINAGGLKPSYLGPPESVRRITNDE